MLLEFSAEDVANLIYGDFSEKKDPKHEMVCERYNKYIDAVLAAKRHKTSGMFDDFIAKADMNLILSALKAKFKQHGGIEIKSIVFSILDDIGGLTSLQKIHDEFISKMYDVYNNCPWMIQESKSDLEGVTYIPTPSKTSLCHMRLQWRKERGMIADCRTHSSVPYRNMISFFEIPHANGILNRSKLKAVMN